MPRAHLLLPLTILLTACSGSIVETTFTTLPEPTTTVTATATAAPTGSLTDIMSAGATHFEIPGALDWLLLAGGVAWGAGDAPVTRIDTFGKVLSTTQLPGSACLALDQGFGSVWAGTCGTPNLVRLDAATGAIQAEIPLPVGDLHNESSIAVGDDAVWAIAADEQTLVKVDPTSNKVAATYPSPKRAVAVRAGFGSLWITAWAADTLYRVDPKNGQVIATIKVGRGPRFLTVGEGGVWTLNQGDGSVSHVDPATNTVKANVPVDTGEVEGGDIAAGGGAVWARVTRSLVARIDPTTDTVTAIYGPVSGSGSVAADATAAWISAHDSNSVWRLPHD